MTAIFNNHRTKRFFLHRQVANGTPRRIILFIGINPSTADETLNDASVRKMIGFAKRNGDTDIFICNVFAHISTDVRELANFDIVLPDFDENMQYVMRAIKEAHTVVPMWGARAKVPRSLHWHIDEMLHAVRVSGCVSKTFGLTKGGDPKHPLMLGYNTPLVDLL